MSWLTFWNTIQKDEQWVVNEIAKGWAALQKAEQTVATDVTGVFAWITAHHQDILNLFTSVLKDLAVVGVIMPSSNTLVSGATLAIDAATAAIDSLAHGIQTGNTPLSTLSNAYHAVKDAQTAVTQVLKKGTSAPATIMKDPGPLAPGPVVK